LLNDLPAVAPRRLSGAGIPDSPPAMWVLRCAFDVQDRIEQVAGPEAGAGQPIIPWNALRDSLAGL
jgi:hypothetical protein